MSQKKINLKGILCALMSSAMILTLVTPASAATARATTMKLEKTEGTVTLKTQNGSTRKISKGMRLYNGNTLATAKNSYAHISLDSTKAVKLDQSSQATLHQNGKQLELMVKSGKLFFNVSKKLSAKESMNVRTSTMVTGVRGTCGVVEYVSSKKSKLYLIEGQVTLGTGQNATVVEGGQVATVILEDKPAPIVPEKPGEPGKEDNKVITVEKLAEKNIPLAALEEIVTDPILQAKIEQTTELKIEKIKEAFEQFQKEKNEGTDQDSNQDTDKDKEQETEDQKTEDNGQTDSSSGSSSGSGGSGTSTTPAKRELVMQGIVTSGALTAAFQEYDRIHIKESNAFQLNDGETLIIPNGKELILWNDQSVSDKSKIQVGEGGTKALLCVAINDGSTMRNALSAGTIEVTAGSRLEDHGTLDCARLSGGENAMLINNKELRVSGTMSLSSGTTYENHGYMSCKDLNSAGGATIKNTDRMILSGAYTSKGTDKYFDDEDAVVVSQGESTAMPSGYLLMTAPNTASSNLYYYYAGCMGKGVITSMGIPTSGTSGITWNMAKNAVLPAGDKVEMNGFHANMNGYELQVKGTLTLSGETNITGSGSATVRLMSGGNLIFAEGSAATVSGTITNSASGCAIARDGGTLTWNDVGVCISGSNGGASAIQNATVSGAAVTLPNWVTVKAGYMPIWKDNMITLQTMPSEFTSGTVTAAELNQALSVHETVTVGTDAKADLSNTDIVTVPQGKTLNILSKVTQLGSAQYSGGFYLGKNTTFMLEENATLNVKSGGFFGGNGIITAKAGARIAVEPDGTLQADEIKLAGSSSITNDGLIDGGSITSEGNAAVTNNTLIKLKNSYTTSGSKDTYTDTDNSALITGGSSPALADDKLLACNSGQNRYCYATKLNTVVASYMNADSWTFSKNAIVPSASTAVTLTNFSADMGTNQLEVQGDLTFTGTLNITGAGAQTIYLNGGTVTLGGIAASGGNNVIKNTNTSSGCAIGYSSGSLVWNDSSLNIIAMASVTNGVSYTIAGSSENTSGTAASVTLPGWVTGVTGKTVLFDQTAGKIYVSQ